MSDQITIIIGTDSTKRAKYLREKLENNPSKIIRYIRNAPGGCLIISDLNKNPDMKEFLQTVQKAVFSQ